MSIEHFLRQKDFFCIIVLSLRMLLSKAASSRSNVANLTRHIAGGARGNAKLCCGSMVGK